MRPVDGPGGPGTRAGRRRARQVSGRSRCRARRHGRVTTSSSSRARSRPKRSSWPPPSSAGPHSVREQALVLHDDLQVLLAAVPVGQGHRHARRVGRSPAVGARPVAEAHLGREISSVLAIGRPDPDLASAGPIAAALRDRDHLGARRDVGVAPRRRNSPSVAGEQSQDGGVDEDSDEVQRHQVRRAPADPRPVRPLGRLRTAAAALTVPHADPLPTAFEQQRPSSKN